MLIRSNAHYYEKALLAALNAKEPKEAIKVIGLIEIYEGALQPSLNVTDENGMNFLRVMLDSEFRDAAKRLLESKSFTLDPTYLFGVNTEGQTLLCQAAQLGYKDIVKLLYHRFIDDAELNLEGNKNWFKADNKGNTPLHYAVQSKHTDLYIFIIEKIRERNNAVDMIDAANQEGDTALHFAVGDSDNLNTPLIDTLLTAGAYLHHVNTFRQSPFQKILQKDSPEQETDGQENNEQVKLLCSLNNDNKKSLLDSYSDYLKKNPADKKIWKVYASFKASKESLKDLTIAHLEHNPDMLPQMNVRQIVRTTEKKENNDSPYPTETVYSLLSSLKDREIGKQLPRYYSELYAQQGIFGVPHSFYKNMASRKALFKQDTYGFKNVMDEIQTCIEKWEQLKPSSFGKRAFVGTSIAILGGLTAAFGYTIDLFNKHQPLEVDSFNYNFTSYPVYYAGHQNTILQPHYDCNISTGRVYLHNDSHFQRLFYHCYEKDVDLSTIFSLVGSAVSIPIEIVAGFLVYYEYFSNKREPLVYKKEWDNVLHLIQNDIIAKFYALDDDSLPTDGKKIKNLEEKISQLGEKQLKPDAITQFTQIKNSVESILKDMLRTQRPFSKLEANKEEDNADEIIEINEVDDTLPLLSRMI